LPDTAEQRIRELEQGLAVVKSQVSDLTTDVAKLNELAITVGRLDERMGNVETGVAATRETIGKIRTALEDRDKAATDERKATRVALIALTGTIITALVGAVVTIIAAGPPS